MVIWPQHGDRRNRFNKSVVLRHVRGYPIKTLTNLIGGHRRTGVAQALQAGHALARDIGHCQQSSHHGGNECGVGDSVVLHRIHESFRVVLRVHNLLTTEGEEGQHKEPTRVRDRTGVQVGAGLIREATKEICNHVVQAGHAVSVRSLGSFGLARGAARIVQRHQCVGINAEQERLLRVGGEESLVGNCAIGIAVNDDDVIDHRPHIGAVVPKLGIEDQRFRRAVRRNAHPVGGM